MRSEAAQIDADRTFHRILSISLSLYAMVVLSAQMFGERPRPFLLAARPGEPARVARLLIEPRPAPAPLPPPTRAESKIEKPRPLAPPKIEKSVPPSQRGAQERVKKTGLLGLLGKENDPTMGADFSSLQEIPFASSEKSQTTPSFDPKEQDGTLDVIEKIRRKALQEEEKKMAQTRRVIVEEDLSRAKITQEGSARSQEAISGSVRRNKERLGALYAGLLEKNPGLKGGVTVEFVISPEGRVVQCRIVASSLRLPSFEEAILQEILRWKFPSMEGGSTTVLYPISFFPDG